MKGHVLSIGALAALALVLAAGLAAAEDPNVEDVEHFPTTITSADTVEVTLFLSETEDVGTSGNVTGVEIIVCDLTDDVCELPDDMDDEGDGTFTYTIQAYAGGTEVGYKFEIAYENETVDHPGSPEYFTYTVEEDESEDGGDDDDDGWLPFPGAPMVAAAAAAALMLRSRKM